VNFCQRGFFEAGFLTKNIGSDPLKRQGTYNKNDFAIGPVGNALSLHVKRLYVKKIGWVFGRQGPSEYLFFFRHA
jgi:hypothetical protein